MNVSKRALQFHKEYMVVDAHSDTLSKGLVTKGFSLPAPGDYFHSGVNFQVFALYTPEEFLSSPSLFTLEAINLFYRWSEEAKGTVIPVKSKEDLCPAGHDKLLCLLSIEGGEALEGKLFMLDVYYRLGVRAMGLTWNNRNHIADGNGAGREPGGLTYFGEEVVKRMDELGMIIDLSHIAEKGFWDVVNLSKKPLIASHSNCRHICNHSRNLTDEQILAISKTGGVIGITFVPSFLCDEGSASVRKVAEHIEYIVNLTGGYGSAGLGSDFYGTDAFPENLEDMTCLPVITDCLLERGHSPEDIKKILGANWLRVFSDILS